MKRLIALTAVVLGIATLLSGTVASAAPLPGTSFIVLSSTNDLTFVQRSTDGLVNGARVDIFGLDRDENVLAVDFRPANGRLYGVSNFSQLYVIDHNNGWATKVGAPFSPALEGAAGGVGFDFNPVVDRIRIVTASGQNLRVHPDTGETAAVDGRIRYATAGSSRVTASAYTNPDNNPATGTTLYNIDVSRDMLVTQNPPNDGVLNTVGGLGFGASNVVGFDTSQRGEALIVVKDTNTTAPQLYSVDLATGKATWEATIFLSNVIGMTIFNNAANPNASPGTR